ncbi:MAG: hypothetical protein IPM35_38685 [Myxococcales bacterium]|nr:hypothetical protein [Myxococcales bacterium]
MKPERSACANVIFHQAELDRRKLYLEDACSSLFAYCTERLGYSEDSATKRVRVARSVQQFPQVLDELASGELHLTGLFLLSGRLTEDNAEQLLAEARGKSKRQLEELLARWFPRPDVPPTITPVTPEPAQGELSTWSGAEASPQMRRAEWSVFDHLEWQAGKSARNRIPSELRTKKEASCARSKFYKMGSGMGWDSYMHGAKPPCGAAWKRLPTVGGSG